MLALSMFVSSHLLISFAPFQLSHKLDSSGWTRHSHGMVRALVAMLTWHSNRRFFARGKTVGFLSFFFPMGMGRSNIFQPKNTRKGDSKQIVTQITGQRHTEVRVEMVSGGKMGAGFQVFSALNVFSSFDPSGWNPGWNRNFWWILYDFLVSASCGPYIP